MEKRTFIIWLLLLLAMLPAYAQFSLIDSISIAGSSIGDPSHVRGGRIALQKEWAWRFDTLTDNWYFSGYWDVSYAYWRNDGDNSKCNTSLHVFSVSPMFRLQREPFDNSVSPYLHASVSPAFMSSDHFGRRDLGSRWTFQDFLGVGIQFGRVQQYDLSLHYLHYSNAGLALPNAGVDIFWVLMFRYHFT